MRCEARGARGVPITYVSRQLGHKDAAITLRVHAHWLPDTASRRLVDGLDDRAGASPHVTQASPPAFSDEDQKALSALTGVVSRIFASWNLISSLLARLDGLHRAA